MVIRPTRLEFRPSIPSTRHTPPPSSPLTLAQTIMATSNPFLLFSCASFPSFLHACFFFGDRHEVSILRFAVVLGVAVSSFLARQQVSLSSPGQEPGVLHLHNRFTTTKQQLRSPSSDESNRTAKGRSKIIDKKGRKKHAHGRKGIKNASHPFFA